MSPPLVTNENHTLKAESIAHAVPEPAAESNDPSEHTELETDEHTNSEDYLDQIFAKVHDLLVLLRNSWAKEEKLIATLCTGRPSPSPFRAALRVSRRWKTAIVALDAYLTFASAHFRGNRSLYRPIIRDVNW
ncbi:hypothetical protein HYPSUDRAFT_202544 [Hypholoma sublateritium FD-334 SS-4]|uniref:Uncharacterized protein n=1 Tax=Hypholoma sublateritium (strain FD-334 SS-4) TaxID=945553 RepID=A0A0D2NZE5_HYPSF|nr:hypothetical protein HYPSUDRAFT_202544 [Hypholoma sublateritium FD-334 SS-4]